MYVRVRPSGLMITSCAYALFRGRRSFRSRRLFQGRRLRDSRQLFSLTAFFSLLAFFSLTAARLLLLLICHESWKPNFIWIDAHINTARSRLPAFTAAFGIDNDYARDSRLARILRFIAVIADWLNCIEFSHVTFPSN